MLRLLLWKTLNDLLLMLLVLMMLLMLMLVQWKTWNNLTTGRVRRSFGRSVNGCAGLTLPDDQVS